MRIFRQKCPEELPKMIFGAQFWCPVPPCWRLWVAVCANLAEPCSITFTLFFFAIWGARATPRIQLSAGGVGLRKTDIQRSRSMYPAKVRDLSFIVSYKVALPLKETTCLTGEQVTSLKDWGLVGQPSNMPA